MCQFREAEMAWMVSAIVVLAAWMGQSGAKALFYDAGGYGVPAAAQGTGLRPITIAPHQVNGGGWLPVGMHFWLETESGTPISHGAASATPGKYILHVRHNNEVGG